MARYVCILMYTRTSHKRTQQNLDMKISVPQEQLRKLDGSIDRARLRAVDFRPDRHYSNPSIKYKTLLTYPENSRRAVDNSTYRRRRPIFIAGFNLRIPGRTLLDMTRGCTGAPPGKTHIFFLTSKIKAVNHCKHYVLRLFFAR